MPISTQLASAASLQPRRLASQSQHSTPLWPNKTPETNAKACFQSAKIKFLALHITKNCEQLQDRRHPRIRSYNVEKEKKPQYKKAALQASLSVSCIKLVGFTIQPPHKDSSSIINSQLSQRVRREGALGCFSREFF